MSDNKRLKGLDFFRIISALLVVAIHTSPFASLNENADFILTRIIARCAVPFFLMVTGYFSLPWYLFYKSENLRPMFHFILKSLYLYTAAIILYLPVNIYAGHFKNATATDILRMLIFDGTFYHLWYLPASVLGVIIVISLGRKLKLGGIMAICIILYFIGLAGDSYYGVIVEIPAVRAVYDAMFSIFSYTRNGIFYAPVFLVMGAYIKQSERNVNAIRRKRVDNAAGFLISLLLMIAEGMLLHKFNMQRHDSMYIALIPCMFFLFQLILGMNIRLPNTFGHHYSYHIRYQMISMWIYIIHPLMIIAVRGIAKVTHLEKILVQNSLIHYAAVCIISCLAALVLELLSRRLQVFFNNRSLYE
ncbi:MAG: acyltransferase [Lachnospiraceae bacterium]|nr:acyltransferase [Lachnospiraceae bacterium]